MHGMSLGSAITALISTCILIVRADSTSSTTAASPSNTNLPPLLSANVPTCAQSCLAYYISQQYVGICDGRMGDASCLCNKYSSGGYALGELAFLCLNQQCGSSANKDRGKVYTVCDQYAQAVEPTHATLTVLYATYVNPSPTNTIRTGNSLISSLHTTSSSKSQAQTSGFAILASTTPSTTPSSPSAPARTTSSTYTDGAQPEDGDTKSSATLTSAQAVGVALGAFGAFLAALGAAYLCVWLRRRKRDQNLLIEHYEKAGNTSQDSGLNPSPPSPIPFEVLTGPETPTRSARKPPGHLQPWNVPGRTLGIGQAAMSSQQGSRPYQFGQPQPYLMPPRSMASQESLRRTSRLLPDRPIPPPLVLSQQRSVDSLRSPNYSMASHPVRGPPLRTPTTIPEEERAQDSATLPPHIFGGVNQSRHDKPAVENFGPKRPQNLSISIPSQAASSGISGSVREEVATKSTSYQKNSDRMMPNAPARQEMLNNSVYLPKDYEANHNEASILHYYAHASLPRRAPNSGGQLTRNFSIRMPDANAYAHKPTEQSHKPAKMGRKQSRPKPSRRESAGSETSFETADPDEPTPPDEYDQQLSPVHERSPISGLKYPKVPRSSNQLVPRSPPLPSTQRPMVAKPFFMRAEMGTHDSSIAFGAPYPATPKRQNTTDSNLSGSTLAAQRRGDSVARDLERMLDVDDHPTNTMSPYQHSIASTQRTLHYTPSRQESPLKGYGKSQQNSGKPDYSPRVSSRHRIDESDFAVVTPPWDPVFTPRRHGDDLYLSVN